MIKIDNKKIIDIILQRHKFMRQKFPYFMENWDEDRYQTDLKYRIIEIKHIMRYLPQAPSDVLEIGMGGGQISYFLHKLGYNVYGLDDHKANASSLGIIEQDNEILRSLHPGINCRVCELEKGCFPFPDVSFNFVVSNMVLEHLPVSPKNFISEIYRVLRPKGIFYAIQPNICRLYIRAKVTFGGSPNPSIKDYFLLDREEYQGHIREYSIDEMVFMFRNSKFEIQDKGFINLMFLYDIKNSSLRRRMFSRLSMIISQMIESAKDTAFIVGIKQ